MINVARPDPSVRPYTVVFTEAQFVKLYSALWAMGYALIPGMPVVEDVVHRCYNDAVDALMEVECGDIGAAIIRQGQKDGQ